jgi:tetratricopeptide (TPR) repeat protein
MSTSSHSAAEKPEPVEGGETTTTEPEVEKTAAASLPDADESNDTSEAEHSSEGEDEEGGEEEEEEADEDANFQFPTDEDAEAERQVGLAAYNEGRFEDALDTQYRVVRHFSNKYGSTSAKCGKYFLDYGLSQLRLLQGQTTVDDVLQPRDEDALMTCYVNLEVARVCYQKLEAERGEDDVEVELALAEVHNALAQLSVEKEDYDAALREYEAELLQYRSLQDAASDAEKLTIVPAGRVIAVLYGIADCFMKEGDFEGAEERLQATLDEVQLYPAGTISTALVEELKEVLAEAQEMKGGKFQEIQDAIQHQFAVEAEQIPTPQEFFSIDREGKHPFLSAVPGANGDEVGDHSYLSMPMSASGQALALNEHSNSQSVSLFPPQGSRSNTPGGPVQHATVRKKLKRTGDDSLSNVQPENKKTRAEPAVSS